MGSAKSADHGDKAINFERQKELDDRLIDDKKKLGMLKNLGHTDLHRKGKVWYNKRPGEDESDDSDKEQRLLAKRLREDPLTLNAIPAEFRTKPVEKDVKKEKIS